MRDGRFWLCLFFFGMRIYAADTPEIEKVLTTTVYQEKDFSHLESMKNFSKEGIAMHLALYSGYVKNTNLVARLISTLSLQSRGSYQEYGALKRRLAWEFNGMRLHEYYFDHLGGNGSVDTQSMVYKQILAEFGSFAAWKQQMYDTAMIRGIGWVILYYDPTIKQLITIWVDDHNTGHLAGCYPIVVVDLWEHAYLTQFGLNRKGYLDAVFAHLDWKKIDQRLEHAKQAKSQLTLLTTD